VHVHTGGVSIGPEDQIAGFQQEIKELIWLVNEKIYLVLAQSVGVLQIGIRAWLQHSAYLGSWTSTLKGDILPYSLPKKVG
jgi:hypothetical protein